MTDLQLTLNKVLSFNPVLVCFYESLLLYFKDDRLMLEEAGLKYCIMPNTKDINTKSHAVKLTFYTNGHVDAHGFRMFYSSGDE